jgi:membrane associated rhomboid family serine protease
MDRMLARLERRFGGIAIPNLTAVVVAGMGAVFVMSKMRPEAVGRLYLDFDAVRRGELWRLVTYLFLPNTSSAYFILFSLLFVWSVGSTLENHWGAFRYNLFYVLGCVGTTAAAWLTGHAETNFWLNLSLMLAFGTLFPDVEFSFYFLFPIKAKWFAIVDAAYVAYSLATGDASTRAAILAALSGYFILCGGSLNAMLRGRNLQVRQAARRASLAPAPSSATGTRTCAICGASEADGTDIRVCSCAKCAEPRTLCLAHARSH